MRKYQKKQAAEFAALLGQAHGEIRDALGRKDVEAAMELLEQCQEGAIGLGNLIESTEGEGAATVRMLEDYCELLYRLHERLRLGEAVSGGRERKVLQNALARIQNSIRMDIPVRLEVVFLPYKASMWDSLESVWRAADEDPDCDAYVIPIPYYDKNPDGSFGRAHYEGGFYPKDVPVLWYEDYDFENRRPDMAFIHNPYDELNIVTSVDPFFYSKNLKRFTEQLVYIPYFILGEIDPGDKDAVEGMAHFCATWGVVNADRVVVQSEEMRQAYVRVMTEWATENGYDKKSYGRAYWEGKIWGLGSPKIDKVLNTNREELEIPEEWLRVIRKPDGSWKKVILYNTSLGVLLRNKGRYLEKMREVFRIFYENRDEVALLWRPHPLMKATIESMRPELCGEYGEIVKKYREDGWGIYDDTADVDRAMALGDGYYGDPSSLVQLCRNIGLPVMIQNPEV